MTKIQKFIITLMIVVQVVQCVILTKMIENYYESTNENLKFYQEMNDIQNEQIEILDDMISDLEKEIPK